LIIHSINKSNSYFLITFWLHIDEDFKKQNLLT